MKQDNANPTAQPQQQSDPVPAAEIDRPSAGGDAENPVPQASAEDDSASLDEILSRFDGRHNFKPQKPAYLSISALVLSILGWLALFFLPEKTDKTFDSLFLQIYIMMAVSVLAFVLALLGRKRAPGISFFAYIISGGLFLFFIIALIVLNVLT